MTPTQRAAMEQALEWFDWLHSGQPGHMAGIDTGGVRQALRAALAEQPAEQAPVATRARELECVISDLTTECKALRSLLHELVVIEGPQPGTSAWADKVLAALEGTAPQPAKRVPHCTWSFSDDDSGTWASACGELWSFIDGGPTDNRVRHCQGCGRPVTVQESPQ